MLSAYLKILGYRMRTVIACWEAARKAWHRAAHECSAQSRFYQVAGFGVQLNVVGAALADRLLPALQHVQVATQPPIALTVYAVDGAASPVALPMLSFGEEAPCSHAEIWGYLVEAEQYSLFYQPELQLLSLLDQQQQQALYWVGDAKQLSLSDGGAPLLTLWHWWFSRRSYQIVHGAAVGTAAGSVLLVGKSGSGKSTTALTALETGLCYAGDDYVLLGNQPTPVVHSLYSSGKVHFADMARFPRLAMARTETAYTNADKALYFFAKDFAEQLVPTAPLKAILLPTVTTNRRAALVPLSPAAAMLAAAPSTVLQLVGARERTMQQLAQFVRQLPCYQLRLGVDRQTNTEVLADLLATLRGN
jgi:hypothetical protein